MGLLSSILEGKYDDSLDRIQIAVENRKKQLAWEMVSGLEVGDRVEFVPAIRPTYLRGMTAKVREFRRTRIVLDLDHPVGRFYRGIIVRPTSIRKVKEG